MRKKVVIISAAAFLILSVTFTIWFSIAKESDSVIATVNGEPLYSKQINRVLKQYDDLSRDEVIEASIDDMLLVQYGKKNGCVVSEDELSVRIHEYKDLNSYIYSEAIKIYGETDLKKGLENRIIIEKAKDLYLNSISDTSNLKTISFEEYLALYKINKDQLDSDQINLAKEKYVDYQKNSIIKSWLDRLKEGAEIKYF
jgi:hypothetical protein